MSKHHPIFDDKKRKWDLPKDLDLEFLKREFGATTCSMHVTERGIVFRLILPTDYYLATTMHPDFHVEPKLESISQEFWDAYIVPHIIIPPMIDMTGEFDGDDIELAQIIMDEIEEGRI